MARTDPLRLRRRITARILRPIVHFYLKGSNTFQDFVEIAKGVFIEVAVAELERKGQKTSLSRLSVATGLNRKELARLYKSEEPEQREAPSILARVMNRWQVSSEYTRKDGSPRVLSCNGEGSEFYELVHSVDRHAGPGGVLQELERTGLGTRKGRRIRLEKGLHLRTDAEEGFAVAARDIESLLEAVEQNIFDPDETLNLHIRTEYTNIFLDDLPETREWLLSEGKALHRRAREFLAARDKDLVHRPRDKAGGRVVLGAFSLALPPEEPEA